MYLKSMKGLNMINRKQFDKLLIKAIKDFEVMSDYDMVRKLKTILRSKNIKDLSIPTITPLIELIVVTEQQPIVLSVDHEIRREHKKMKKYLQLFFSWEVLDNNLIPDNCLIVIRKKGANNE